MKRQEDSKVDTADQGAETAPNEDQEVETTASGIEFDDSLEAKLKEAEERSLRLQAELENFRRRKSRESQEMVKFATMPLVTSLLEVVDNLQRALSAAETADNDSASGSLREGVEMVAQQLETILENHGCKKIDSVGEPFDPNLHEAIQMQPSDEFSANHVMMEVQTGYTLHDRVVRPSKVMVSTGPAN